MRAPRRAGVPLRVLFVEDNEGDLELMVRELEEGGFLPDYAQVETSLAMRTALDTRAWDLVIADYTLPSFSAPEALAILKERDLDVPCIVVSGSMDEAIIVATMRFGAHDYLLKGNLARLVPAVERELRDAGDRGRRRHAEHTLKDRETYLRAILENVADCLITVDEEENIHSFNRAASRVFGYTPEEITGRSFKRLLGGRESRLSGDSLAHMLGASDVGNHSAEVLGRRKSGSTFPMELRTSVASLNERTLLIAILRDVTERKRTEAERTDLLKQAEDAVRARDEFLSVASHELKTPLTALLLEAQNLARHGKGGTHEELSSPRVQAALATLNRQVDRMTRLIQNLLDVSRITAGRLRLELEELDLSAVVRDVLFRSSEPLAHAGCELVFSSDKDILGGWDALRLEEVVTNLISNAIKYGAGKPIEVEVHKQSGTARLVVRDHGMGIAPADRARIFERFERAVSERQVGGLGLGLWIVRQMVNALGGEVSVESEVGQGSTFTVMLPCQATPHGKLPTTEYLAKAPSDLAATQEPTEGL